MGGGAELAQLLKWTEADANASSRPELTRAFFQLQDALRDRGDVVTGKRRSNPVTTGEESGSRGSSLEELEAWQGPMRTLSSLKDNAETALQLRAAYAADVANCLASLRDEASSAGASSMLISTFSLPVDCRRVPSPCCIVVHTVGASHVSRFRRLPRGAECHLRTTCRFAGICCRGTLYVSRGLALPQDFSDESDDFRHFFLEKLGEPSSQRQLEGVALHTCIAYAC